MGLQKSLDGNRQIKFKERGSVTVMKKFQFYKNIILVVASALTLVAVTFAWFSTSNEAAFSPISAIVDGDPIRVAFYQADVENEYQTLTGDIELDEFVPGNFNKYKFEITTKTADKLKLGFRIENLPADMPQDLKDSVCIKYSIYSCSKSTAADGAIVYTESAQIAASSDYVSLSELIDGTIFSALSLSNYQSSAADRFVIYYEIGLAEDSPSTISGLESSLGDIKISAQRAE